MAIQQVFSVLSDKTRREILNLLKNGKMSAGDISSSLGIPANTLSYHLKKLKSAELVYESKYKNYIFYELDMTILNEICLWIEELKGEKKSAKKIQ
ncbi:MAG: metalloregulator ArsR/SmtB family transcription factor [Blautia sp.]